MVINAEALNGAQLLGSLTPLCLRYSALHMRAVLRMNGRALIVVKMTSDAYKNGENALRAVMGSLWLGVLLLNVQRKMNRTADEMATAIAAALMEKR